MPHRHIINHNPTQWADDYLSYMRMFDVHASEIEAAMPSDALSWHIVDQLKSMARAAFDVQACILRVNDIPHDDNVIDNMKDKEVAMSDLNIHNTNLAEAARLIQAERELVSSQLCDNPQSVLAEVWGDLGDAVDKIMGADMEWFEALNDEPEVYDVFAGRNVDAINWTTAKAGDYVVLRDLYEKAGTGAVYMLVTDPSFKRNGAVHEGQTMSVIATLVHAPTTQWPVGTGMLTFDERGWQAWRDFGGQS